MLLNLELSKTQGNWFYSRISKSHFTLQHYYLQNAYLQRVIRYLLQEPKDPVENNSQL